MSSKASSPSVGGTLAGGIQDVAALLPLIGTEQCEKHVGSALSGGYLYSAAAPLSIFGSLGIVKAGMSILISSISISIPNISISFSSFKPSIKYSGQRKWLGGRIFKDAGFELVGVVGPLIGMDGHRFKAETRLIEILEEKHIEDPEKITVDWKSRQWNIMLVLFTILGAGLSIIPYIALLLGPASWRPTSMHLPWIFPALRIVGSCTVTVACQFIIQSRVISLMKNRLLFTTIDQQIDSTSRKGVDVEGAKLEWDASLPAEQCIWSLEQYISIGVSSMRRKEDLNNTEDADGVSERSSEDSEMSERNPENSNISETTSNHLSIPMSTRLSNSDATTSRTSSAGTPNFDIEDLHRLQQEHFPTPTRDAAFFVLSWIFLALSLPATVAGYIGCFTLVSATPSPGNGPLVWVGLEGALSILRIIIWASNPSFDEETEVRVELKLSEHQPLITTLDYNLWRANTDNMKDTAFTLVPEREFLERITPYTGPIDQFQKVNNITLYFTLTTQYDSRLERLLAVPSDELPTSHYLFMTVFDPNMQIGASFVFSSQSFHYFDVGVKYNTISQSPEATIQSETRPTHPWRFEHNNLFKSLEQHYLHIMGSFNQRDIRTSTAILPWKWDLSKKAGFANQGDSVRQNPSPLSLTNEDQSYLYCGYEHKLKTNLVAKWSEWIVEGMGNIRLRSRNDCHEALSNATSEKGVWELTELDGELVWGWASREFVFLTQSLELEKILRSRMEICASGIDRVRGDRHLRRWISSEFESGRRKRMDGERQAAKKRMEKAMNDASEQAEREGRPWGEDLSSSPASEWTKAVELIDRQWSAAINNLQEDFRHLENRMQMMMKEWQEARWRDKVRDDFVQQLRKRVSHVHWRPQHKLEEQMMKNTVERIRILPLRSTGYKLEMAYQYPNPDERATAKFVTLFTIFSRLRGQVCSAMVYDADVCDKETVCRVIAKSTTRSVLNVEPKILPSIPPNDHILFLSCRDGEGEEPIFVQRNRDRWWNQQTKNSSMFYFTPEILLDGLCISFRRTIAHILVSLTAPSTVHISVVHRGANDAINVLIRENGEVLGKISDIPSSFKLQSFQPFVLQKGRHELELVPLQAKEQDSRFYSLWDILTKFSDVSSVNSLSSESSHGVLPNIEDSDLGSGGGLAKDI